MKFLQRTIFVAFILLLSPDGEAQFPFQQDNRSNKRQKIFAVTTDSLVVDTVSIIPGTLFIEGLPDGVVQAGIPDSVYFLDFVNAKLFWKNLPPYDSVRVHYRVFPFKLNPVAQRMNFDSIMNYFYAAPFEFNDNRYNPQKGIFDFGTMNYNGSFGRSIAFGNNQDVVVNSNLNLQLNGMLGDSIMVAAAITDNNIPIQPDGTTQQLNEFDRVFYNLKKLDGN